MRSISVLAVLTAVALPALSAPAGARDIKAIISGGVSFSEDSTSAPSAPDTPSDVAEDTATPTGFGIIASSVIPTASYDAAIFSSLLDVLSSLAPTTTDASDPSSTAASSDCSPGVTVEVGSDDDSDDSDDTESSDSDTPDEPGPGDAADLPSMEGEPHKFINRRTALLTATGSCDDSPVTSSATFTSVAPTETSESLSSCLAKCSRKRAMDETHDCVDNCYSAI
ncbi:hypothetical protein K523DRAFT_295536 [Schizophyllum commune Tattone D]|nr:hypothetical protein K523DRAFT_295536 [Schizophyllum commune Tattone D]